MNDTDSLIERFSKLVNEANEKQTIAIKENIQAEVSKLKLEIKDLKNTIEQERTKVNKLEEVQKDLQIKYNALQKSLKKNNIVIFGAKLENTQEPLAEYIIQKINQWLELNLTVECLDDVYLLGKSGTNRPVLVKLQSYLIKVRILRECKKLKGSGFSISEDLTKEERGELKALIRYKKVAQNEGHKAYIKNNTLYINNEKYTLEKLQRKDREAEAKQNHEQKKIGSCSNTPTIEEVEDSEQETDEDCIDNELIRNRNGEENTGDFGEATTKNEEDILNRKLKSSVISVEVSKEESKQKGKASQKFISKTKKINTRSGK